MTPLRARLHHVAEQLRIPQPVVEKDYALSYILAGLASQPILAETLVVKGGTALKKCFFGNYRFSEDLDCSTIAAPRGPELEAGVRQAINETGRCLSAAGPFIVEMARYVERAPHPGGQEAFTVRVRFPWYPGPLCRVIVEITHDEPVLLTPETRAVLHGYGEELAVQMRCYRLEEIVVEKMRALLQTHQRLVTRGWHRPRTRDYYDLWRILGAFGDILERDPLPDLLARKSAHRGVSFQTLDDIFSEALVSEARVHWDRTLGPFVVDLPPCDQVIDELRGLLPTVFPRLA
jgi:predicted nucleotidyltransferase component of viral defense system